MSDFVLDALSNQEDNPGHGQLSWSVTFINGETKTGKIMIAGDSTYALEAGDRVWFFTAEKVIHLEPHRKGFF